MRRRVLNLLTAVSLLLCVAVVAGWAWSLSADASVFIVYTIRNSDRSKQTDWSFASGRGSASFGARTFVWPDPAIGGANQSTEWEVQTNVPAINPAWDFDRRTQRWWDFGL